MSIKKILKIVFYYFMFYCTYLLVSFRFMDQDNIMVEKSSKSSSDAVPKIDERSQILR